MPVGSADAVGDLLRAGRAYEELRKLRGKLKFGLVKKIILPLGLFLSTQNGPQETTFAKSFQPSPCRLTVCSGTGKVAGTTSSCRKYPVGPSRSITKVF